MAASTEVFNATELKTEILKALATKDDSIAPFACHGKVAWAVNPGLEVQDHGLVGLPISPREAELLIGKCRKSPFGRGEKTVVDDSVRKSWELNPSEFQLINPAWSGCMEELLSTVHYQLGLTCARANIHAELYKLLIYEPGAFFKPHQDSEKTPGMFGTLVLSLPSQHQGGRVVLSHNKQKAYFDSASYTTFDTSFGAWYSDVFHEVERVTSGYRIVLTFNLVQKASSLAQKAPDADSKARLKRALQAWEHASMSGARGFPPYLVHRLDHQYSGEYLDEDTLRGTDAMQVHLLNKACQETGWDIYLATHEKTLTGDDDWGMGDFDRDDEYKDIVNLNGGTTKLNPDYDRSCYLDGDKSSIDGDADESEHEGYTGNEGAPATFWYRKCVALLVPPSRAFEFGLTPENKNAVVLKKLAEMHPRAHNDPEVKKQLRGMCNIVLELDETSGVWPKRNTEWNLRSVCEGKLLGKRTYDVGATSCEKEIAKIALEQDWLDVFDDVPIIHRVESDVLQALGQYLHVFGVNEEAIESMNSILHEVVSISAKHAVIQRITEAFKSASDPQASAQLSADFEKWQSSAIQGVLTTKERATEDDGAALAKIAKTSTTDVTSDVLIALKSADTKTVAAFIIEFATENSKLDSLSQRHCLQATIEKLWSEFRYGQPTAQPSTQSFTASRMPSDYLQGNRKTYVDFNSLGPLLTITKDYCGGSGKEKVNAEDAHEGTVTAPSALRIMADAVRDVDEIFLRNDLLTFILQVVSHKISALIISGDGTDADNDLYDALSHFIVTVLATVIRHQGLEPKRPTNWSLPSQSCGCQPCKVIGDFMKDPKRREIAYPTNERNRRHLDGIYKYCEQADYTIGVDRNAGSPFKWMCRKEHFSWQKKHKAWKGQYDHLRGKLIEMDRGNTTTGRKAGTNKGKESGGVLRNWLGKHYNAIMECRVEKLPAKELLEGDQDSRTPLKELGQASANERQNRKRGLDGEGPENAKRPRFGSGEPEIIDLT